MPVVGAGDGVPTPVGRLEILEDEPGLFVALGTVAPDVEVPPGAAWFGGTGALEPRVPIRGVIADELGDDPDAAVVGFADEGLDVRERAVVGVHGRVVGYVVAVVAA